MIQSVYAAGANQGQTDGGFSMLIFMALFFLVFYFVAIRPKQKQQKQHQELVGGLNKGDEIITHSGIMGKIIRVQGNYTVISIADNVEIKLQKNHINNVLPKGTLKSI